VEGGGRGSAISLEPPMCRKKGEEGTETRGAEMKGKENEAECLLSLNFSLVPPVGGRGEKERRGGKGREEKEEKLKRERREGRKKIHSLSSFPVTFLQEVRGRMGRREKKRIELPYYPSLHRRLFAEREKGKGRGGEREIGGRRFGGGKKEKGVGKRLLY